MARYEDILANEPRASWFDQNAPAAGSTWPSITGSVTGAFRTGALNPTGGGGKFAGLNPQAAWETAKNELGYTGSTPQDQATLQKIADYLAQNGMPGFKATGADTIQIPGGQIVDVLTSGNQWWWGPEGGAQGGGSASAGGAAPPSYGEFAQGPGAIPPPYASQAYTGPAYQPPALPTALQTPYQAPTWSGSFTAPTQAQVEATPGYATRLAAGQNVLERSAAAKGSILSGGTQKALSRFGQEYGANEYGNAYSRALGEYQQRYGEFLGGAQLGLQGRQEQANEYGQQLGAAQQAYMNPYQQYLNDQQRQLTQYLTNAQTQSNEPWSRYYQLYSGGLQGALGTKTNIPPLSS